LQAERRQNRKTPMFPSHESRYKREKKARGRRPDRSRYDVTSYRQAIERACEKAGVPRWHPHQLKHAIATEVRRLHGAEAGSKKGKTVSRNGSFAAFDFSSGSLMWSEAGSQKRASLHLAAGEHGLRELDPGGLEILSSEAEEFTRVLLSENHTLKRALTDPGLFSGIGNAYSDEILWEARLSPMALTQKISAGEIDRLYAAARTTLTRWVQRLRQQATGAFPEGVTAFRPEMAVHGKYRQACPRCGATVQRIKYAANETDYCPGCQTGGKLLADRALSRLLREDWPKTPEELEMRKAAHRTSPGRT